MLWLRSASSHTILLMYFSMVGIHLLFGPFFIALVCGAQTFTTTNLAGQSIVEVTSIDPIVGLPTTITLSTLAATNTANTGTLPTFTATSITSTSTSSTTTPQAGPVGQPAQTTATPGAPTPFTYTTIIGGQTFVSTDVFTPTNPATTPVEATMSGTIWNLSSYLSQYGQAKSAGAVTMSCLGVAAYTLLVVQITGLVPLLFYDLNIL